MFGFFQFVCMFQSCLFVFRRKCASKSNNKIASVCCIWHWFSGEFSSNRSHITNKNILDEQAISKNLAHSIFSTSILPLAAQLKVIQILFWLLLKFVHRFQIIKCSSVRTKSFMCDCFNLVWQSVERTVYILVI